MVLVVVVFAFMIMFKVKISPQTVITIQSALPKIFVTLILITFSYAIAGLLIDLMYVATAGLAWVANAAELTTDQDTYYIFRKMTEGPFISIGAGFGVFGWVLGYVISFCFAFIFAMFGGVASFITSAFAIGALVGFFIGTLGLLGIIMFLIGIIYILWVILKIIFTLLKAYASILLLVMFAPVIITFGALTPNGGFNKWVRSLISNLAIFPTMGFMFVLAFWFLGAAFNSFSIAVTGPSTDASISWEPPLLGIADSNLEMIYLGVSFIMFVSIPKAADLIKSLLAGQSFNFGAALTESIWASRAYLGYASKSIGEGKMPFPLGKGKPGTKSQEAFGRLFDTGRGNRWW